MLHTYLCDLLDIRYPVLNAPMAGTAAAPLAAAVSGAGGFGMIGGSSGKGADWLREQIRAVRAQTDRPFGVGFISSFPDTDELMQVALDEGVAAVNHSFADPTPYVDPAHARGIKCFAQVQTVAQATRAARAGVDLIIAQGTEAGGHTGTTGTLALLPAVVDAVGEVPVVAAGGIADGRGFAAALLLGAVGVWVGTRFVASEEWSGSAWEQAAVLAATADDTVHTSVYDRVRERPFPVGIADRVLRNRFNTEWQNRPDDLVARRAELRAELQAAAQQGDASVVDISAGVGVGLIHALEPAGEIVKRLTEEAEDSLRSRYQTLLRA